MSGDDSGASGKLDDFCLFIQEVCEQGCSSEAAPITDAILLRQFGNAFTENIQKLKAKTDNESALFKVVEAAFVIGGIGAFSDTTTQAVKTAWLSRGGVTTGKERAASREAWQATLLPAAKRVQKRHPKNSRSSLAIYVMLEHEYTNLQGRKVGLRSIENWLRDIVTAQGKS